MTRYHMPIWLHVSLGWLLKRSHFKCAAVVCSLTLKAGIWGKL